MGSACIISTISDRAGVWRFSMAILGVDVAKNEFHAVLLFGDERKKAKAFPNNRKGFDQLAAWLHNRGVERVHACLEATGGWSEALAADLHDRGHIVSLVNPQRIKDFGRSEGQRTKTDSADAALIARFASVHRPDAWLPPRPEIRALQALARRREALIGMRTQESNRLAGPEADQRVRASLAAHIEFLDVQLAAIEKEIDETIDRDPDLRNQRDLIESIPGLGRRSATSITAEFPRIAEYRDAKAVAAHAGLCPAIEQSGTSLARSRLSRSGSSKLRRLLYFPALVAIRWNPVIRSFAGRLRARGKRPMVIVAAAMRKLLVLAYGVVKSGRPFDLGLTTQHGI
jgi:transposase